MFYLNDVREMECGFFLNKRAVMCFCKHVGDSGVVSLSSALKVNSSLINLDISGLVLVFSILF